MTGRLNSLPIWSFFFNPIILIKLGYDRHNLNEMSLMNSKLNVRQKKNDQVRKHVGTSLALNYIKTGNQMA